MEADSALYALAALANPVRLAVFRLLTQYDPDGLPAGAIAQWMSIAPASLTFHLKALTGAGLLAARSEGPRVFYTARHETMGALIGYLTDCCGGASRHVIPDCTASGRVT